MKKPTRKIKRVYIAGPYRADTAFGIERNIMAAKRWAAEFWKRGIAAFCPHANTAHFDGIAPDEVFLEAGLDFLLDCDALVVIPEYHKAAIRSEGTAAEMRFATSIPIPIFYLRNISPDAIVEHLTGKEDRPCA